MPRFRRSTTKGNTYLQYVESYRNRKGQPATRVLAGLGNVTKMSEDKIESLVASFIRATGMEDKFQRAYFQCGKGYHYGTIMPVIALWHQLGMEEIINKVISSKVQIPVSRIALIQIANRFSEPCSKLACYRWYWRSLFSQMRNFINFPDSEDEQLHMYYRSLDYLCEAKEEIEIELYHRLIGFGMDNSIILYDITSTYFEGTESEIGVKGYSRDRRSDADQIIIGIVMSRDGIPITHHVFEGNRLDKTTVKEVIADLKRRFGITNAIFVGDRGMITFDNIDLIKDYQYNYILGLQKRNRRLINHLLNKVYLNPEEAIQEFGYSDLSKSLQKEYCEDVRIIASFNKEVAQTTKETRQRNMKLFEELVDETIKQGDLQTIKNSHYKLKSFLSRKHMVKLYSLLIEKADDSDQENDKEIFILKVKEKNKAIEREERLDGRYFLQTEVQKKIDKRTIDSSYRSLQKVERAFRVLKNEFDIQPSYVRRETRIRGHVIICYFALLIETLIEKRLKELFPPETNGKNGKKSLTMMTLFEELDTVRLIPLEHISKDNKVYKTTYISTKIENSVKKVLSSLLIKNPMNPKKLSFGKIQTKSDENQLKLNLGINYLI